MIETLANGTHLRVLRKSFPMNTNMIVFRRFLKKSLHPCAWNENSFNIGRVIKSPPDTKINCIINEATKKLAVSYYFELQAVRGENGPAPIAEWSRALPLTAYYLTTNLFQIPAGACEKVASDLKILGCDFCRILDFPRHLYLSSHYIAKILQKKLN